MDIDVTDLSSYEITQILTNYLRGKLVIKHDRIFWDSVSLEPVPSSQQVAAPGQPRQSSPGQGNRVGQAFSNMADTLGSMVCPPGR